MVSDSVGLGAKNAMSAAFPPDWQVTVDGTPALFVEQLLSKHVKGRAATNPSVFGDDAIVAGGYNYPFWDPGRFDRSVDAMVDELVALGTKHVFWVTLREVEQQYVTPGAWTQVQPYFWYFPTVNQHLRAALDRHPQLSLIDWASIADRPGLTYDAIHLNTYGAAQYANLSADVVLTADRRLPFGTVTEIQVAGVHGVPADAKAVALNLTSHNPRGPGFFTAYPCDGPRPTVSNLNFVPGQIVAASAIVPIGANGKICVFQYGDANLIVDLTGSFGADSGLVPVWPTRAIDTRETARVGPVPTVVHLGAVPGVPLDRSSVAVNLTTIGGAANGILNVYPCDGPGPGVPTRTILAGQIQNLLMITAVDPSGDVCVTASQPTDVILDVFGSFTAGADVHPLLSTRLYDSGGIAPAGTVSVLQVAGRGDVSGTPTAAVLSVNATSAQAAGFVTAFPCASGLPNTSMLNTTANHDQGNGTIVAADAAGQVCLYQLFAGRLTVDLTGWTGSAFQAIAPVRLFDSRETG
ncbi:MAG: hypothetical protein JWM12_799 [Ilumatobacteraceae bacterium]|nr:hypothetical protein [Ilumatobacteraceae bacterium]